jgi:uncharacterized protein (DUF2384 family)
MLSPPPPSVEFVLPLTHEVRQVSSFSELLRLAGTRVAVGRAWGVALRTYDRRKKEPGSTTVAELKKLAWVLKVNEQALFALISASLETVDRPADPSK